jgi:hypothetical protein
MCKKMKHSVGIPTRPSIQNTARLRANAAASLDLENGPFHYFSITVTRQQNETVKYHIQSPAAANHSSPYFGQSQPAASQ